jgi:glutaconyl-CoA/methylmalonyl-CoA decarboxylase subunit gamma
MSKQLRVKVNGNAYDVEVGDFSGGSAEVKVNGKPFSIEIEEMGGALPSPVVRTPSAAPVVAAKAAPVVSQPVAIAQAGSTDVMSAPMPGVILDIKVKAGDSVKSGETICALEAMKMKNLLRSPRDGTVASVEVCEGQRVPFGAIIIRFA